MRRITVFFIVFSALCQDLVAKECRDAFGFNYEAEECNFLETENFQHSRTSRNVTVKFQAQLDAKTLAEIDKLTEHIPLNGTKCSNQYEILSNGSGYTTSVACRDVQEHSLLRPGVQRCLPVDLKKESFKTEPVGQSIYLNYFFHLNYTQEARGVSDPLRMEASNGCLLHFDIATVENKTNLVIVGGSKKYIKETFYESYDVKTYKENHTIKSHKTIPTRSSEIDHFFAAFRLLDTSGNHSVDPFVPTHPRLTDHNLCFFADLRRYGPFKGYCRITQLTVNPTEKTARPFLTLHAQLHNKLLYNETGVVVYRGIEKVTKYYARFILVIYCNSEERFCDRKYAHDLDFVTRISKGASSKCFFLKASAEPFLIPGNQHYLAANDDIKSPLSPQQINDTAFCTITFSSYPHYHLKKYKLALKKMHYFFGDFSMYNLDLNGSLPEAEIRKILDEFKKFHLRFVDNTLLRRKTTNCMSLLTRNETNFFGERRRVVFCICRTSPETPCNTPDLLLPHIFTMSVQPSRYLRNDRTVIETCLGNHAGDYPVDIKPYDPALAYDYAMQTLCVVQKSKLSDQTYDRSDTYRANERDFLLFNNTVDEDAPYIDSNSWTFLNRHERIVDADARALMHVLCEFRAEILMTGCKCAYVTSIDNILCCCNHKDKARFTQAIDDLPPLTYDDFFDNMVPIEWRNK
ncbi:unnamed protein product [Bursaphelenchus xylophilus]|uniref:(pine wood nematode) hypothetical protein n=1 Tax=Bursaphelenchus xylophilus TaxID=6326 RepID=A0A1I7SX06_BURXY|nr:unnamed protein product [Bursaphelenchus xylophilus]CAG9100092.1 unnamed protein product [Bursaphelenchus xylophilus]